MSANRERAAVVVLACLSVALVGVASAARSYVPLFVAWLPQFAIPLVLSRSKPKPLAPVAPQDGSAEAEGETSAEPKGGEGSGTKADAGPEEQAAEPDEKDTEPEVKAAEPEVKETESEEKDSEAGEEAATPEDDSERGTLNVRMDVLRARHAAPRSLESGTGAARLALAALAVAAGAVHASVTPEHARLFWLFGVFFVLVAFAQMAWGIAVLLWPSARLVAAGALGNASLVAVWALSRTAGVPLGPTAGAREPVGSLDLLATGYEALIVVFAFLVLYRPGVVRSVRRWVAWPVAAAAAVAALAGAALAIATEHPWSGVDSLGAAGPGAGRHAFHLALLFATAFAYAAYVVRAVGRRGIGPSYLLGGAGRG